MHKVTLMHQVYFQKLLASMDYAETLPFFITNIDAAPIAPAILRLIVDRQRKAQKLGKIFLY